VTAEDPRTESLFDINTAIAKGAQQHGAEIIQRFANTKQYHNFLDNTFDDHHSPHNNSSNDNEIKNSKTEDNTKTNVKNTILSQLPDKSIFLFDEEAPSSRYDAIDLAVQLACKGDLVITQGKGHEQSLCFGKTEYPFSDHEAVQKALTRLHNHNMYTSSR
jgi:UDP-N-acetylmuramyl tripeptide synthase